MTQGHSPAGSQDVVIGNQRLAIAVSQVFDDPQLSGSTVGKPVDMAVSGRDDQIDWFNLPYVVTAPSPADPFAVLDDLAGE